MGLKRSLRKFNRRCEIYMLDAADSLLGRRPPLVPPRWLNHNGTSFEAADEMTDMVKDYAELTPNSAVLDLGCGMGRLAYGLTKVLGPQGCYVGVDIVERAIDWMQAEYASRHPNFKFHHLDVHSAAYNPQGKKMTDEIDFDFLGGQKFDIVVLYSVFTHLNPAHVRHYLKLIRSVLKPDGRLLASAFINDAFAKEQTRIGNETGQKLTARNFRVKADGYYSTKEGNAEFVAAYDPEQIAEMWSNAGMRLEQPFRYGSWCKRPGGHHFYQDVTIGRPA